MLNLFILLLRIRYPPTLFPAFDLPVDRGPDAGSDGDVSPPNSRPVLDRVLVKGVSQIKRRGTASPRPAA